MTRRSMNATSPTPDGDLLRVVGIYGANASGKSNLITALATLRTLVLNSATVPDHAPPLQEPRRQRPALLRPRV